MVSLFNKIIKHKLALSFLLILLLFISFGIVTIKGLLTVGNLTRTIYNHPLVVSNSSLNAALYITKMHRSMKDVVLANSPVEAETALKTVAEDELTVYKQLDTIRDTILGREGESLERQTRHLFSNWKPIRKEVVRLLKSGNKQKAILITKTKGADHVSILENKMLELTSYARKKATIFLKRAETSQARLENITIILTVTGVIISVFIAFFTTFRFMKSEKLLLDEKSKLQKALDEIQTLRGIIPICSYCKQIRDDEGSWEQLEKYIHSHSEAQFSHSVCPTCMKKHHPKEYAKLFLDKKQKK